MAEIELSVFGRTMKNYLPEQQDFFRDAQALATERNQSNAKVDWQFRTPDARIKLKQLYPSFSSCSSEMEGAFIVQNFLEKYNCL